MHHAGPTAYAVGLPRNGSATSSAGPNPGRSGPNPVPSKPKAVRPGTRHATPLEAIGLCVARFRLPVVTAGKAKHATRCTTPVPRLTPLGFHGTGPPPRPPVRIRAGPVQIRSRPSPRPSGLGHATPRRLKPLGFVLHGFACPLSRRGKPNTPRDAPRRSHGLRRWASTERVRRRSSPVQIRSRPPPVRIRAGPVQIRSRPSPRPSGLGHATPRRLKPLGFVLHGFACPLSRRGKPNTPRDAPRRSHGLRRWASTERVRHLSRRSARSAFDHTSYTRPGATNSTFRGPAAAISAAISAAYRALRCTTIQRTSRRSLRISSMKLAEQ